MGTRSTAVVIVALVAGVLSSSAIAAKKTAKPRRGPTGVAFYTPPSPIPGKRHGDLIWSRGKLVLYRSTSIAGAPIAVSGTVALPTGKPPKGGWPVITWAHGTTGIADQCAPSRLSVAATSPLQARWLKAGYAVVNTDYEGLGTAGVHPYLIGNSEGRGVLDIVRAAQQLYPGRLSNKVAIAGHSQGGQSALFAAALAPTWTPELKVQATVAFAPVSHLEDQTGLLASTNITSLSGLVAMIIRGDDVADPSANISSLLTPQAAALYPQTLTKCLGDLDKPDSFGSLPLNQMILAGADLSKVIAIQKANDAAFLHIHTAVLIEQGNADTTVFPVYTSQLQNTLVANGVKSTLHTYPDVTHGTVVTGAPADDATNYLEMELPPGS